MKLNRIFWALSCAATMSACVDTDERSQGLNACPADLKIETISCSKNDTVEGESVQAVASALRLCNAQLNKEGRLPLSGYQYCQGSIVQAYSKLKTLTCQKAYVDQARCVLKKNISKEVDDLIHSEQTGTSLAAETNSNQRKVTGRLDQNELDTFLNDLAIWHEGSFETIYGSHALKDLKNSHFQTGSRVSLTDAERDKAIDEETIDGDRGDVLEKFWAAVLAKTKSDELLKAKLDFYAQNAALIQIAESVLAKTNFPVPLLLQILGDSLKPLSERVSYFTKISDLGCTIDSCSTYTDNGIYRLVNLLGSMGNREEVESLKPEIEKLNLHFKPLFETLIAQAGSEEKLLTNFVDQKGARKSGSTMLDSNHDVLEMNVASTPRYAREILSIVQSNRMLRNSYLKSGLYWSPGRNITEFGFESNLDAAERLRMTSSGQLDKAFDSFEKGRPEYGQSVLAEKGNGSAIARLKAERDSQALKVEQVGQELTGLRNSLSHDKGRFESNLQDALNTLNNPEYNKKYGSQYKTAAATQVLSVGVGDTPEKANSQVLADIVKHDIKIDAKKGELVNLSVDGVWSPTCALLKSGFKPNVVAGAQAGPEGFMMSNVEGKASIHSASDSDRIDNTETYTKSASLCFNAWAGFAGSPFGGTSVSLSACLEKSYSSSHTSGRSIDDSQSSENRSSAAFSTGLRSEFSPFPNFPAGSLLIVQVRHPSAYEREVERKDILFVDVAQKSNVLLVPEDEEIYLAVNDCRGETPDGSQLKVKYEIQEQEGENAKKLCAAMIEAIKTVEAKGDEILSQGEISPIELNFIEASMDQILAKQGISVQSAGPVLAELYRYWKQKELLELDNKSRIKRLERELALGLSGLKAVERDIDRSESQNQFYDLQNIWALANLDLDRLTTYLSSSIDTLTRYVIPVVKFQAPSRIESLRSSDSVKALRDLELNTPVDDIAKHIKDLNEEITSSKDFQDLRYRDWVPHKAVVLSFADPALTDRLSDEVKVQDQLSGWLKAPRSLSELIWKTFRNGDSASSHSATFSIRPEDLYGRNRLALSCGAVVSPVINAMGIYFVVKDDVVLDSLQGYGSSLTLNASGPMRFPQELALENFSIEGKSKNTWLKQNVPFTIGQADKAEEFLSKVVGYQRDGRGSAGAGLSPFMDFSFNFAEADLVKGGSLEAYLSQIREILFVFDLKYRPSTIDSLEWLSPCSTAKQ